MSGLVINDDLRNKYHLRDVSIMSRKQEENSNPDLQTVSRNNTLTTPVEQNKSSLVSENNNYFPSGIVDNRDNEVSGDNSGIFVDNSSPDITKPQYENKWLHTTTICTAYIVFIIIATIGLIAILIWKYFFSDSEKKFSEKIKDKINQTSEKIKDMFN